MSDADDSLTLIKLVMSLEDSGLGLTDEQYRRVDPYFVTPAKLTVALEGREQPVHLIARRELTGLAISLSGHWAIGNLAKPKSQQSVPFRSFDSTNAALVAFLPEQ